MRTGTCHVKQWPSSQVSYSYDNTDYHSSQSELMGALRDNTPQHNLYNFQNPLSQQFPGPYHPDYLTQITLSSDALPFASVDSLDIEGSTMNSCINKQHRMSTDSISEPPSSAVSFSSYTNRYSTSFTTQSQSGQFDVRVAFGQSNLSETH
jgi:GATA-binding protein, other eukaryote